MSGHRVISFQVDDGDEAHVLLSTTPDRHDLATLLQSINALMYDTVGHHLRFRICAEGYTP